MRPIDTGRVHHRNHVRCEKRLAIEAFIGRAIRGRITARTHRDAAPATREMPHLLLPAAVIAGVLMHKHDRHPGARRLVVDARAVRLSIGHGGRLG